MARMKPSRQKGGEKKQEEIPTKKSEAGNVDLKASIKALGGDIDEDYELVKDAESDGLEEDKNVMSDPKLVKDVTKFMKSLDFGSVRAAATVEQDDAEAESSSRKSIPDVPKPKPNEPIPSEKVKIAEIAAKALDSTRGGKLNFVLPPTSQWYTAAPVIIPSTSRPSASPEYLASKSSQAATLLEKDATLYAKSSSHTTSTADARFLSHVLTSGTLSDRLSALILMVQGSPIHNIRALDSLKAMASKKGREESLKALRAIVDWLVGGGAPDRKLKFFRDQPITHPDVTDQHLIMWHFEDWLKKYFFATLQILEGLSADALPYIRTQAMHLVFQLLREKPEQEQNLLRLLVNKLNDSDKSVASKASHHLLQLLQLHPQMKKIIVHEVSSFILRPIPSTSSTQKPAAPEGNTHARYYAVITFNQIVLTPGDKEVAMRLIDVYFELFKELLGEDAPEEKIEEEDHTPKQRKGYKGKPNKRDHKGKGKGPDMAFQEVPDANSKLVSAILTGVNRALPFAKTENSAAFDKHIDTVFRITHTATFSVSLQALMLIHHVSTSRPAIATRFHRALYASILDPRLSTSSKQAMYLNLVFKALKADRDHARVAAFVKRFVQTLGIHRPEFICGGLYLLGELFGTLPDVRNMTNVPRNVEDIYDPHKRDPQFAHAETTCLWELLPLLHHYHPSVSLHARQLLMHTQVTATADLGLNTLSHFLDRFVYRNAKKPRQKGASAMQPAAYDDGTGTVHSGKTGRATDVVNAEQFRKKSEGDVPVDQVFFHKFFSRKHDKEQARAAKADKRRGKDKGDSDEDEGVSLADVEDDSDPEEAEVWAAMKKSVPELAGSDVGDEDSLPSDLDGDEGEDEDGSEKADATDVESLSNDGSELDFIEDEDDIVSDGDGDDPTGLMDFPSGASGDGDAGEEEWQGFFGGGDEQKTRKRGREKEEAGAKKKRQKLATFASYEDYAEMIDNAQEDDI
ncbi:CBF/Mak21 family-domain-containing protein [Hysterangium stoloniferum]|nr:CBF/Mak21 family-domain-containing protein [Hysterangium stoloniferum]